MNKAELVDRIRRTMNRPSLDAQDIDGWIENVEGELNRLLKEHPRNQLRSSYEQPFDNPLVPLPQDLMSIINVRCGLDTLTQFGATNRDDAIATGKEGVPCFIQRGMCIEVFPTALDPGDGSTGQIYDIDYIASLNPLTVDLSENWVSAYFADVYLYGCLKEGSVLVKDDKRLATWGAEFYRRVGELVDQGWNQNIAATPRDRSRGRQRNRTAYGYTRG